MLSKTFNAPKEMNSHWKNIFRKIMHFILWRINVDSIQFIRFLLRRFALAKSVIFFTNLPFVTFNYSRNFLQNLWNNFPRKW